ncbi:hypothetical protein [Paraburkholderia hospita]|uniref:hypothetical protein n=1 Tax=Paraburkholderia hospita TaxID=169430 RepID=UPI00115FE552|nr:hypothetical protein [Paraburkholderia hospita]
MLRFSFPRKIKQWAIGRLPVAHASDFGCMGKPTKRIIEMTLSRRIMNDLADVLRTTSPPRSQGAIAPSLSHNRRFRLFHSQ